jgi:DNA-binding PadR family transcriptional regulator
MRQTPVLSTLELALLGRIREEPQTGYAIRKTLPASPGAVYPALKRLAAAGLIEGTREGARNAEVFEVTASGKRALRDALARPSLEEMRRDPQSVAARLRFVDGELRLTFLEDYARLSGECAADLRRQPGLVADHDAALYAARARWAAAAIKRLRNE